MTAPSPTDSGGLLYPPDNRDPNKNHRRWPWIVVTVVVVLAIGGGAVRQVSTTAPSAAVIATTQAASPTAEVSTLQSAPATPTTMTAPDSAQTTKPSPEEPAVVADFVGKLSPGDPTAVALTVPGSPAHLYAESVTMMAESNPSWANYPARKTANGWDISGQGAVILTGFHVTPDGLVDDLLRNGTPISMSVAPGDGAVYAATPGQFDSWTGQATATVHSFRLLGGELQVVVTVDNQTSKEAYVSFDNYVLNGKQYAGSASVDPTMPGIRRTTMVTLEKTPAGGVLSGALVIGGVHVTDIVVAVPKLQ